MKTKMGFILFAILFIVGCSLPDNALDDEINVTEKTARLIEAENQFGFELFQKVYASETTYENTMVSPLSVSSDLLTPSLGTSKLRFIYRKQKMS
jgi:serine protease inhibitor